MEAILARGEVAGHERKRIGLVGSLGGQFGECAVCTLRVTDADVPLPPTVEPSFQHTGLRVLNRRCPWSDAGGRQGRDRT